MNATGCDIRLTKNDLGAVMRDSDEWNFLEYLIQMETRTSRVCLLQAWQISPLHILNQFERRTQGRLVVYSFVDASTLDDENSVQEVARRGIKVGNRGMKFSIGNFSLPGFPLLQGGQNESDDPYILSSGPSNCASIAEKRCEFLEAAKTQLLTGERRVFEFFLCQVGIGHSIVVEDERVANGEKFELHPEYDSAYIQHGEKAPQDTQTIHYKTKNEYIHKINSVNKSNHTNINIIQNNEDEAPIILAGILPQYTFKHEYVVYDSSQVLPKYFLIFEMDPSLEEVFTIPLCDNCQDAPASSWCPPDTARLCAMCDERLHSANKLVARHIRVPLNEMPRPFGCCKFHSDEVYELFCTVCYVPICRLCRPNHIHSDSSRQNVVESETLIPLRKAYKGVLQLAKKPHYVLETRKNQLSERLQSVQKMLDDVRCSSREVEQRCYSLLEDSINQAHELCESKMGVVLNTELETQRQTDMIQWSESFLHYLKAVLPPADYLVAWLRHCRLRDELEHLSGGVLDSSQNIFPDMRLEGRIDILTDSALRHEERQHPKAKQEAMNEVANLRANFYSS